MKRSFLIRGNPLRHSGRTRRATSPYYGEADKGAFTSVGRTSPFPCTSTERRASPCRPLSAGKGEGGPPQVGDEVDFVFQVDLAFQVDLLFRKKNLPFVIAETSLTKITFPVVASRPPLRNGRSSDSIQERSQCGGEGAVADGVRNPRGGSAFGFLQTENQTFAASPSRCAPLF